MKFSVRKTALAVFILLAVSFTGIFNMSRKTVVKQVFAEEIDFSSHNHRGFIDKEGTYIFYSRGADLTSLLSSQFVNGKEDTTKIYDLEFPLQTKEGFTVYARYYIYGKVTNQDFLKDVFINDGEQRWVLTDMVPDLLRQSLIYETKQVPYSMFTNQSSSSAISTTIANKVSEDMTATLNKIGFKPVITSVLVYKK